MGYNPLKNICKRIHLWYILFIVLILFDELLKEDYLFNPSDILKPLTHENILILGTIVYIISLIILLKKRRKREN